MSSLLTASNKTILNIPDRANVEEAIHWVLPSSAKGAKPHFQVMAGISTRVKIILEEIVEPGADYDSEGILELTLAKGACVNLFHIQQLGSKAKSQWTNRFHLKQHASLDTMTFTTGSGFVKNDSVVHFEEEHAFCSLKGLSIINAKAQVLHHLLADHQAPHGISRQHYKNVLAGSARSEFHSLVDVAHGAIGSDTRQLCRNLLLSDHAQGYSCPQLKISTDDVACSHGATTGQLDEQELFYLRSRGLSSDHSKHLMIHGFAMEVVEELQDASLKERLALIVEKELKAIT